MAVFGYVYFVSNIKTTYFRCAAILQLLQQRSRLGRLVLADLHTCLKVSPYPLLRLDAHDVAELDIRTQQDAAAVVEHHQRGVFVDLDDAAYALPLYRLMGHVVVVSHPAYDSSFSGAYALQEETLDRYVGTQRRLHVFGRLAGYTRLGSYLLDEVAEVDPVGRVGRGQEEDGMGVVERPDTYMAHVGGHDLGYRLLQPAPTPLLLLVAVAEGHARRLGYVAGVLWAVPLPYKLGDSRR